MAGATKPFSHTEHAAFQQLLATFGDPASGAAKQALAAAVQCGDPPCTWSVPRSRNARQACRIGLRQLRRAGAPAAALAAWARVVDGPRAPADERAVA